MKARHTIFPGDVTNYIVCNKNIGMMEFSGKRRTCSEFLCTICKKVFLRPDCDVKKGYIKSCGCLNTTRMPGHDYGKGARKYDNLHQRTYTVWQCMKDRCYRESSRIFKHYGGKGVVVCDRWLGEDGYFNFLSDMGESPIGYDIDRILTSGNYEPENCRYIPISESRFNRGVFKNNTSGKTGVVRANSKKLQWHVRINVNGKRVALGLYESFDYACEVRDLAELRYYGYIKDDEDLKRSLIEAGIIEHA